MLNIIFNISYKIAIFEYFVKAMFSFHSAYHQVILNYHLTDVVAPGQEQNSSVVLLPVRKYEGKQDNP